MSFRESEIDKDLGGFRPVDIATCCYLLFEIAIILIFMRHLQGWIFSLFFYLIALGMVFMFTLFPMPGTPTWWKALRIIYPAILIVLFYEALRSQVFLIHSAPFDAKVYGFEKAILGRDIYFEMQRYMTIGLNEMMSFFYMSYYLLIPGAIFLLALKRQWGSLEMMILAAAGAFYFCYFIFITFPVTGPRFFLEGEFYLPMVGPFFTPLARHIVESGGLHGGAMPSSHCAIALVAVVFMTGELKTKAFPLWIVLLMLCFGTVYGRYHYASDVVVGLAIGALSIILTTRWQNGFLRGKQAIIRSSDLECEEPVETGAGN